MALADTARLIASLELQDKFSGPASRIRGSLGGLERGLGQMGRGAGQLGTGLARVGTVAAATAAGGLAAVVTTAASMEEAFTGVEKTATGTLAQFEELRQGLRTMSAETGTAFEELARIGEVGGALGVGIQGLDEFVDVVNRLSVSTDLTADTAATAIGTLRTILHLEDAELEGFADTLVALGNAGASTEPQIVDLAARFAAAGNRAGLSADEILALSSAVSSMGVEVEAGGTALSQVFNNIAVAIGTGSKEVQGFTDVLGISAAEFRRRWETDALGTFQDFLKEISKLDPIAQAVALDMAGITGARQLSAIGLMADNYGFVGDQLEVAADAQGDLRKESDKFFGTSAAGFRKLRENVRLAADTVGAELLPVVNELITEFVGWLSDPVQQRSLKEFGKNLAGGIRDFAKEIRNADFGQLLETFKGAAGIAKTAFDAFRSLPGPIQQLILAAVVANKVTGGGVSMIASGIGNILAGTIRVAFTGALRGLLPAAAGTAINRVLAQPVIVTNWPPGLLVPGAGGGAQIPGPAAGGTILANVTRLLGFVSGAALVAVLGIELGKAIADFLGIPDVEEAAAESVKFEESQFNRLVETGDNADIVAGIATLDKAMADVALAAHNTPWHIGSLFVQEHIALLRDQRDKLLAQLSVGERIALLTGKNYTGGPEKQAVLAERLAAIDASIGSAAQADHADAMAVIPNTAVIATNTAAMPQLPDIVEQVRTAIGTAAQADRADAATATARLAAIHTSIGTAAAADHADTHSAAKAAAAIIDSSIGSAAQSDHADAVAFNARIDATKERIAAVVAVAGVVAAARAAALAAAVQTSNARLAVIAAKKASFNVTTHVISNVSISDVQRRITSQQIAQSASVGGGGFAV